MVDCGLKYNQLRCLISRGARLDVVAWDYDLKNIDYDGLFLSNGPGDPAKCEATIDNIRSILESRTGKPIFGICLGHQLLCIAAGCVTYKMKYVSVCISSKFVVRISPRNCCFSRTVTEIAATINRLRIVGQVVAT